jgi:hypothetical protein
MWGRNLVSSRTAALLRTMKGDIEMGNRKILDDDALGGQVLATRVGLHLPKVLEFPAWERAGQQLTRIVDSSAWCLGDWVVYGESHYADRYRLAVDATGLDYGTLRNYASVARRIPLSRRRDALSFQHHAEVVTLPTVQQELWLDRAEKQKWSRNQLRHHLKASKGQAVKHRSAASSVRRLSFSSSLVERWRAAAEQTGSEFEEWVVSTLDAAATGVLDTDRYKSAS